MKLLALGRWRGSLQQEDIPVRYIRMSDHIDSLGVTKARKLNCDEICDKFSNIINSWKSGRYMSLTLRPWSLNCYALPKIWYRCHSLAIRAGDCSKMTSAIKSWLYRDMLEKPEELGVFRRREDGGLGLQHIKSKSMALLIKSFLETVCDTKYIKNTI